MIDLVFDMMKKETKTVPKYGIEYRTLRSEIQNRCRQTEGKCTEIRKRIIDRADIRNGRKLAEKRRAQQQDA